MLTENGFGIDFDALNQILNTADVVTIGFTTFAERLLVDTRTLPSEGPLVAVVPPVTTVQERYLWLGQHRGKFGSPEAFSFFVWPRTVRTLIESDALAPLSARLAASSDEAKAALTMVLERLAVLEKEMVKSAIRGDSEVWHTLWQRPAA